MATSLELLDGRLRKAEARIAQLQDCIDIYGPPPPPPKSWPVPVLTAEQRWTVGLALAAMLVLTLRAAYALDHA